MRPGTRILLLLFICLAALPVITDLVSRNRTFVIDFDGNRFLKDGQPFRYISGSVHYFRVPKYYWRDRLLKLRAAGLNAVQFYVPWNLHEPFPGQYDFGGDADLAGFLELARTLDLLVILRLGPYVCGEWENGGLPWWLLKVKDIRMRSSDPRFCVTVSSARNVPVVEFRFIAAVDRWYAILLPMLKPHLYKFGGPIILVQVENEYGSFDACDVIYTTHLRDLFRAYFDYDTALITVDGSSVNYLKCGFIPDVYPTVDFGVTSARGVDKAFGAQRVYAPRGPLVNTEFYPGWLDKWGRNFSRVAIDGIERTMADMYRLNASFNFYMFHGGTNFAFWNGAGVKYPVTTTYDYDAPLSEAADPTAKVFAIRRAIERLQRRRVPYAMPPATPKLTLGDVPLRFAGDLFDLVRHSRGRRLCRRSLWPLTMEDIDWPYGFVAYRTTLPFDGSMLTVDAVKDRAHVLLGRRFQGIMFDRFGNSSRRLLRLTNARQGDALTLLVENWGRQSSGRNDMKGIVGNVSLDGRRLTSWRTCPITFSQLTFTYRRPFKLHTGKSKTRSSAGVPSIYVGKFAIFSKADTYFSPNGWGKGQLFLNGNNVGRYWPAIGPQVTLFVPKGFLRQRNQLLLFELDEPRACGGRHRDLQCTVNFTDTPVLDKPVHHRLPL